jgi:2-hydroxychromene-2-carboxylate isomerase
MSFEVDNRLPPASDKEPDWDNLDASYEAPGARDVVPDMPPIPDVTTPHPPKDNWDWTHHDDGYHKPVKPFPATLREQVSEENPLEVDVFYSMRSPYSYLSLFRLAYLHSCYNVNVNIKVIFPVAARTAKPGQKSAIGGRWYFWSYTINDAKRSARYEGIPFRMFNPDPILADTYPPWSGTQITAPMDKQPYITWLVRLGNAAQLEGKALEYCLAVSPFIFGAQCPIGEWPFHVEAAFNSVDGLNYNETIKDINANPDKYDAVWQKNQEEFQMTGQGGVPTMSFNGEPFFGQDRFNQFFWRLRENGLTQRKVRREPMVARPMRWPSSPGGE